MPLMALLPDQAPLAEQAVALVEDHARVALLPLVTVLGLAASETVGARGVTDTVVDCVAFPPPPEQVSEKVALAVRVPVDCEPLTGFEPVQAPEAVHEVALLDDQFSVDEAPLAIVLGLAPRLTVAVGVDATVTAADCAATPPGPVQVSV